MTTPAHLGGAYPGGDGNTFMPDVYGWLTVQYELKTILDVGSGYGHTLKWFGDTLVGGTGIDGWEDAIKGSVFGGELILHDFTKGPAPLDGRSWDMGVSFEFLEHVDIQYSPNYMDAFKKCRHVCTTHAAPGQHGHHHVSCFPDEFWVELFTSNGFEYDSDTTALLRKTDRWHAPWGRVSLQFFKNKSWNQSQ